LTKGLNYLLRATFYYANYDGLNTHPTFDVYLGVNFWQTVDIEISEFFPEIIFIAPVDSVRVCLDKTQGVPFISSLHFEAIQ
jgi:Malectin-like domain